MGSIGGRRRHLERDEQGLTLVELLVVLLVVGCLLVIAVPTYLNAQSGSKEAVAKSQATQAVKTQKTILLTEGAVANDAAKITKLKEVEPSLDVRLSDTTTPTVLGAVYVRKNTGETLVLSSSSGSECFWTMVGADGVTKYARGTCDPNVSVDDLDWPAGW